MHEEFLQVRSLLANLAMDELWIETRKLIRKCGGYEGAEIYLNAQLRAVNDLRCEMAEGDSYGDLL